MHRSGLLYRLRSTPRKPRLWPSGLRPKCESEVAYVDIKSLKDARTMAAKYAKVADRITKAIPTCATWVLHELW